MNVSDLKGTLCSGFNLQYWILKFIYYILSLFKHLYCFTFNTTNIIHVTNQSKYFLHLTITFVLEFNPDWLI